MDATVRFPRQRGRPHRLGAAMTLETSHDLQVAITDEYVTWRMLRAHLPDVDLAAIDISGLTGEQLAAVEAHLAACDRRRRLLRTALPPQR